MRARIFWAAAILGTILLLGVLFFTTSRQPQSAWRIGISPPADSEFYQLIRAGVEEGIRARGTMNVELLWQPPLSHQAVEDQRRIVENWIEAGLDAIAVTTVGDLYAMDALFARASRAGIAMFFLNMAEPQLEGAVRYDNFVSSVGYNNFEAAKTLGTWVLTNIGTTGSAVVLLGTPGVHSNHRLEGFLVALQASDWTIVAAEPAQWEREEGAVVARRLLTANPDLRLIFGQNDEMALGAVRAVRELGREGRVAVVGLDGVRAAVTAVRAGDLAATLNVAPKRMGEQLINTVLDHLTGHPVQKIQDIAVFVTDRDRAEEESN